MAKEKLSEKDNLDKIKEAEKVEKIRKEIPDSSIGNKRKAEFIRVDAIDFEGKFADFVIRVYNLDEHGELIQNPDIRATRDIRLSISNTDRVIDGILIEPEDPRYDQAVPEFDWWMKAASVIPFLQLLEQSLEMLAMTGRFDR